MKISIKIALCLIMGGGVVAGVAGIVKTISIESITLTDDISYAILDLLIWVMTEVWFIIIFGSLPAIRAVIYSAGRSLKTMTQASGGKINQSQFSQSCNPDWMELSGCQESASQEYRREYNKPGFVARIHHGGPNLRKEGAYRQNRSGMRKYGSEEDILAPGRDDIIITKELTVTHGSDEMARDTLPRGP
ncbi:hypothetical protein LTS02_017743 [Friedmanniomyces endolithicus]|nr:hypothetical protein LTR38_017593 [Friedmanniomyces endolithicus]KAK0772114.1 hypothetical protein LTR75_017494 [Friedmanniomyces endolithicus]KAK0838486.1 hypothetical protein LTS02_017743 [Friedmanniomyces endolithicus]